MGTSTRCEDGRPAVGKLAFLHQAPGRMYGEAWASRVPLPNQVVSQEVEIQPGCAVMVSRLPTTFFAPESHGPGREVRSWIGVDTTWGNNKVWSVVFFSGVPCRRAEFFFTPCSSRLGQERIV